MKIAWLEKMAEDGLIREHVLNNIYSDIEMIKSAKDKVKHYLKAESYPVADLQSSLDNSKQSVLSVYSGEEKAKAGARFDEIARHSPIVASNPHITGELVKKHLYSGLSDEITQKLSIFQAQIQKPLLKNAAVRPQVLGEIVADVYLIKTAAMEKSAIPAGTFLKSLGVLTGTALAVNTIGGLVNWAASKVKRDSAQEALDSSFKEALKGSSVNADLLRSKPEQARQAFQTLVHFAPAVALNPTAARGFMAKLVEYGQGGVDSSDLKGLTEIQRNMAGIEPIHPFQAGFTGTNDLLGMGKVVQHGALGAHATMLKEMRDDPDLDDIAAGGMVGLRAKPERGK